MTEREANEVNDITIWIEKNIERKLSISVVKARAGYSHWHFQRIFKSRTGISLAQYILGRRLTLACHALRDTDMAIIDVAIKFGWDSQDTFTRIFKKKLGITPFRLRKLSDARYEQYKNSFTAMISI